MMSAVAVAAALGGLSIAGAPAAQAATTSSVWDSVAACESSGDWSINTGNGYYGGLQFSQSTWDEFGGQAYASRADLASKADQITVAQAVLAVQGPQAWPVCSQVAGLTASNGGASSASTSGSTSSGSSSSSASETASASSSASTSTGSTSGTSTRTHWHRHYHAR